MPLVSIRTLREAHGLTQRELAERITERRGRPTDVSTISNVESGNKPASKQLMAAWAQALGLHPLDVVLPAPAREEGDAA